MPLDLSLLPCKLKTILYVCFQSLYTQWLCYIWIYRKMTDDKTNNSNEMKWLINNTKNNICALYNYMSNSISVLCRIVHGIMNFLFISMKGVWGEDTTEEWGNGHGGNGQQRSETRRKPPEFGWAPSTRRRARPSPTTRPRFDSKAPKPSSTSQNGCKAERTKGSWWAEGSPIDRPIDRSTFLKLHTLTCFSMHNCFKVVEMGTCTGFTLQGAPAVLISVELARFITRFLEFLFIITCWELSFFFKLMDSRGSERQKQQ